MQSIKHNTVQAIAFAIGVAIALPFMVPPVAHATAVIGATEPTQIMNHIELIAQYEKQVQQAITEMNSYIALQQQLKDLPQNARAQIEGVGNSYGNANASQLASAQQLLDALQRSQASVGTIQTQAQNAYGTLNMLQAQGHGMTLPQYEQGMAVLAQQHADTYGVVVGNYKNAVAEQQQSAAEIQRITQAEPQITSSVGGLKAVVQSNAVLSQQLANVSANLAVQGGVTAGAAQLQAQEIADQRQQRACGQAMASYLLGGASASSRDDSCSGVAAGQDSKQP